MRLPEADDFDTQEDFDDAMDNYYALAEQQWEEQRDYELLLRYEHGD